MRQLASGAFSVSEFALVKKTEPLVSAAVRHFWSGAGLRAQDRSARPAPASTQDVWNRLTNAHSLTAREAAIIELVLQGHSSESIGLNLGISTGTVKVHRRNIYRKLGISSQTQLFSRYFPL
jgi:DNA-binding CsgD family transcriptional regulator